MHIFLSNFVILIYRYCSDCCSFLYRFREEHKIHIVKLSGFGLDSIIEIFVSVIVIGQLKAINKEKEVLAEKLIDIAFLLLALYILGQSIFTLFTHGHPNTSQIGIIWLTITALVMFSLAYGKGKTGK